MIQGGFYVDAILHFTSAAEICARRLLPKRRELEEKRVASVIHAESEEERKPMNDEALMVELTDT